MMLKTALRQGLIVSLITILACLTGAEALMRFFPRRFPLKLALYLPEGPRRHVFIHHGFKSASVMRGEELLYSFRPEARELHDFPIDENGYRNPTTPRENPDVVLLGDSLLIAENVKKDLGTLLRERGLKSYNLGMGGYGPSQYRDAYEKYVVNTGLNPRCVIVTFCAANDFSDTDKYAAARAKGTDYAWYLGESQALSREEPWLWTVSLLRNWWLNASAAESSEEMGESLTVVMPYATFTRPVAALHHLGMMPAYPSSVGKSVRALAEIRERAAKMAVVMMPNWGGIYSPFVSEHADERLLFDIAYEVVFHSLKENFDDEKTVFLDARPALREAARTGWVTQFPDDYHLNQHGVDAIMKLLEPFLQNCGGMGT